MSFSLASIFFAGILTFASPCVLPLMPVYLATIAGNALSASSRRVVAVAAAFCLGLSSVFVALGAVASLVGSWLVEYRTPIVVVSGAAMILFGLRALGVLRIGALDRDARPALTRVRNASSVLGAFLFGAAFALGWSPCIGPVLASLLTFTATHASSPWVGAGYLAVYAAGLSLPLMVLAFGASRASTWVRSVRGLIPRLEKVTGAALVVVGAVMAYGALPTSGEEPVAQAPAAAPSVSNSAAAAASCEGSGSTGSTCDLPELAGGEVLLHDPREAAMHEAHGSQLLEFTAHQCPVCKRMRPVIDRVAQACGGIEDRVVQVDVTTARGRQLADLHRVRGTPTFVFLDEHGVERGRIIGEQTEHEVAATLERAFALSCSFRQPSPSSAG